jgi:hypothetical protein
MQKNYNYTVTYYLDVIKILINYPDLFANVEHDFSLIIEIIDGVLLVHYRKFTTMLR